MGYFEDMLRDVAQGRIELADARRILSDRASFSFGTNPAFVTWREPLSLDTEIPLTIGDVQRALGRYLRGAWTAAELQGWAEFITMVSAFEPPPPPVADEDYYEEFWTVIHDLGTPEVFGQITPEAVRAKLAILARYASESSSGAT